MSAATNGSENLQNTQRGSEKFSIYETTLCGQLVRRGPPLAYQDSEVELDGISEERFTGTSDSVETNLCGQEECSRLYIDPGVSGWVSEW